MTDTPIVGLGEIALRVDDLDEMTDFYAEVIGLPILGDFDHATFFEIAEGVEGHTQILALFDRSGEDDYTPPDAARTTVDHIAFGIPLDAFESEVDRLEGLGLDVWTTTHDWVQWRSLYVTDPEGNRVELVCHDPSIDEA
ncbi:Glyoxalase-like domain-containing protein [Halogranum gelatinilyticum]|uniref:Glyoxalase-like domain-containing protein n=1 Tax=Halogranum gelatinilyticum TaxID=660521 RepID=A0A1G9QY24_9EURY|nr:VOC family protein [Halogranum gelatinilyticum]SDM15497.1 Glyoxalase-like domain-containing protein [Halogranum gelatinilyticum]